MDPKTNRCVIFRDVVFDEISSYFSSDGVDGNKSTPQNEVTLPISSYDSSSNSSVTSMVEKQGDVEKAQPLRR